MRSTKSAIISSYPTSASVITVLLKYLEFRYLPTRVFGHFEGKSMIKLSVSIFGQTTGYRNYTVSREPIRSPEIQYLVFGI